MKHRQLRDVVRAVSLSGSTRRRTRIQRRWKVAGALPFRRVVVAGASMAPTLLPGDCLLVRAGATIAPGDIVVAKRPGVDGLLLVKRAARRQDGGWWLLSDNAEIGIDDSRAFGALPDSEVLGKVLLRYYPWRGRRRPV